MSFGKRLRTLMSGTTAKLKVVTTDSERKEKRVPVNDLQIGSVVRTTIGKTSHRRGVTVELDQIQLGIDEREMELKGRSILLNGNYGKKYYEFRADKLES